MFVLPQFGAVLHDFGAKIDPIAGSFLRLSEFMNEQKDLIGLATLVILLTGLLLVRQAKFRTALLLRVVRLPLIRSILALHQAAMFCRNLEVLLTAGVPLTTALRIIANMMATWGDVGVWTRVVE